MSGRRYADRQSMRRDVRLVLYGVWVGLALRSLVNVIVALAAR